MDDLVKKSPENVTLNDVLTIDPLPAYVYSDDYPEVIPSDDNIPRTGILDLPTEVLLEICQYSRFSDIYSLICVNKTLHAVAVQRFYSLILVRTGNIELPPSGLLPSGAPLREILPHLERTRSSNFCGLFASQKHLDAVRTIVLCGGDNDRRYGMLDTLVQGIFLHCTKIQNVIIKGYANDNPWYTLGRHISFKGITFPKSLSMVRFDTTSNLTKTLLSSITSLTVLEIRDCDDSHSLDQISPDLGATIIEFRCLWDLSWSPTEDVGDFSKRVVALFPNLKRLAIGYKSVHINVVLDAYLFVTGHLRYLQDLTLLSFEDQEYSRNTIASEIESAQQFTKARPSLQCLALHTYMHNGSKRVFKETITWKKGKEDDGRETWTPDPTITRLWEYWFAVYVTVDEVRGMMWKVWWKECDIPSIKALAIWAERYPIGTYIFPPPILGKTTIGVL